MPLAEQKVVRPPISEKKVGGLKIFLHAGRRSGDLVGARAAEEKISANSISEDNSSNLKIFLPERPLLT